ISNEMVAEAPVWDDIAEKVRSLTEGRIFVAHNVRFDYAFVCNEFKRLSISYQRRQLCTVRLSRKILPGQASYSLGRLCNELSIPIEHRHRAFGDGAATAELFNVLLYHDKKLLIEDALKEEIRQSIIPPHLSRTQINALPEDAGVYYFKDERGKNLYIGKSTNIRQRVISHLSEDISSERHQQMRSKIHDIQYVLTGNDLVALLLESHEIKRWMPPFNRAERRKKYRYGIYSYIDDKGFSRLRVSLLKLNEEPLFAAATRRGTEAALTRMAQKYSLCLQKCDLEI
ncbi:MAG: exonuclease domain-containing protein, partial [Bacteroidota bacterium]|nr:exonuclease domain-containing protein [Bacteroidota bacterium]